MAAEFRCDVTEAAAHFPHFWEHTVGSDHAVIALREDWRSQLRRVHAELGFSHVRFHGLLDDDMSILTAEGDRLIYSFFNADSIFDFLIGIGMGFCNTTFIVSIQGAVEFHERGAATGR